MTPSTSEETEAFLKRVFEGAAPALNSSREISRQVMDAPVRHPVRTSVQIVMEREFGITEIPAENYATPVGPIHDIWDDEE